MKRLVKASKSNKSDISEAVSIAQALKYVLDDMTDENYKRCVERCPKLYEEISDFIKFN